MKKVLAISNVKNGVPYLDYKAIVECYRQSGFLVDMFQIDELYLELTKINIEEYDVILFSPLSNALWNSGKNRAFTFEKIMKEAKPGAISMYVSDISFIANPFMWDIDENPEVDKRNVLNSVPIKVIASFDDEIIKDKKAINHLKKIWMKDLHPDSEIYFVEWLSFLYYVYKKPRTGIIKPSKKFRNMYYGLEKRKLKDSLISLGMTTKDDIAYGNCYKMLKNCSRKKSDGPDWINYIDVVENVLVPYEPIKCDYQITLRHLEALLFYKDKIKVDERVSKHIIKCMTTHEEWKKTSNNAIRKIQEIYGGN